MTKNLPGVARTPHGPLPIYRGTPDHSLQGSRMVLLCITASDVSEWLESPALNHLGDRDLTCTMVDVHICNLSREGDSQKKED